MAFLTKVVSKKRSMVCPDVWPLIYVVVRQLLNVGAINPNKPGRKVTQGTRVGSYKVHNSSHGTARHISFHLQLFIARRHFPTNNNFSRLFKSWKLNTPAR